MHGLIDIAEGIRKQQPWHVGYFLLNAPICDPWQIVANARVHLADQIMDADDVEAYWALGVFQDQFLKEIPCGLSGSSRG